MPVSPREKGLDRVHIAGSSVGGTLGLMMALAFPSRVSKLVLVDSAGFGREVSLYVRLASIPGLAEVLESSKVGGARYMLYNVFHDQRFVAQELLDELY